LYADEKGSDSARSWRWHVFIRKEYYLLGFGQSSDRFAILRNLRRRGRFFCMRMKREAIVHEVGDGAFSSESHVSGIIERFIFQAIVKLYYIVV
jgi:hypothetical protein